MECLRTGRARMANHEPYENVLHAVFVIAIWILDFAGDLRKMSVSELLQHLLCFE